jgi:hypothetical protein
VRSVKILFDGRFEVIRHRILRLTIAAALLAMPAFSDYPPSQRSSGERSLDPPTDLQKEQGGAEAARTYYREALELYLKAAETGDPLAQNALGLIFASGKGDAQAAEWFRKAAEQGMASAQTNLGWMYSAGKGVAHDDAEAVRWYGKAADQGFALAQLVMGLKSINGDGVTPDKAAAVSWIRKAAEQGLGLAEIVLGRSYLNGALVA